MLETRSDGMPAREAAPQPPRIYPRFYRKLVLLKWMLLIGGFVLLLGGAYDFYRSVQLGRVGQQVRGRLHEATISHTNRGRPLYKLIYDYTPDGSDTTYRKSFHVSESDYHELSRAGESPITFLPADPEYSQVGAEPEPKYESLAIGVAFLLLAGALAWFVGRQRAKVEAFVSAASAPSTPTAN